MAEAFIFDAVRTPRGRGKADGSLHEVPSIDLAVTATRQFAKRQRTWFRSRMADWDHRVG